ncbi:MAG: hypothetical protein J7M40_16350, partial [Planctomycetes bacterium]|nr:hypothetical protein [Planctomycetota bacterium]
MRWTVTKWRLIAVLPMILVCSSWGVTLFESGYQVETYATYDVSTNGNMRDITFGPDQTLYITYNVSSTMRDGSVYKLAIDGSVSQLADGFFYPNNIVSGAGTAYEDYLYVCDKQETTTWDKGEVTRIDLAGNKTPFAGSGLDQPVAVEIDRTGRYGGYMFVASGGWDRISSILPTGEVELFYYLGGHSGTPWDIAFDPTDRYQGLMYVATEILDDPTISGILTFDPDANMSRFAPDIIKAWDLEFDTTETMFGGDLFIYGSAGYGPRLFRVAPDGSAEAFAWLANGTFTFGPDGAIYVYEQIGTSAVISRIFDPSPPFILPDDPYTATVESIGAAITAKREAIAVITSGMDKERAALEAINALRATGEVKLVNIRK